MNFMAIQTTILGVPNEIDREIRRYLSPKELCITARVCKGWEFANRADQLWKEHSKRDFGYSEMPQGMSAKKQYLILKENHMQSLQFMNRVNETTSGMNWSFSLENSGKTFFHKF